MENLVQMMAERVGLEPETARRATSVILNFINREGPPDDVKTLFAAMPEAAAALEDAPGAGGGGGFGGGLAAAYSELTGAGLDMTQIQTLTRAFVEYGREKVGEDTIGRIVGAIPGLSQFV